jgi:small subunit ribosomal protein S17e
LDRTRRFSEELLSRHPEAFGTDFEENKKVLVEMTLIPSKQLRNRIAGYISKSKQAEETEDQPPSGEEQKE